MVLLMAEEPIRYRAGQGRAEQSWDGQGRDSQSRDKPGRRNRAEHDIPERLLARLWRQRAARQAWLRTAQGGRVRVLYPGRPGAGAGPDFREALLEVEGQGLVRGDVELHVQQRDWKSHGHSQDPNYNGVVLHAVLGVESASTALNNGMEAPVVSLAPLLEGMRLEDTGLEGTGPVGMIPAVSVPADAAPAGEEGEGAAKGGAGEGDGVSGRLWGLLEELGYACPRTPEEAANLLDRAGDQRFQAKSSGYARLLEETGRATEALEQSLYEALMEGLGYRANQQGFLGLAQRAPWRRLVELSRGLEGEAAQSAVHGWLCLVSGLTGGSDFGRNAGPTKGPGLTGASGLNGTAARRGRLPRGLGPPLAQGDWRLSGLRPANHPLRRMAGAAAWVRRFGDAGLARALREACDSGSPADLTKSLQVDGPEGVGAPIGRGRARDIAVNVVLPFLQAADGPGYERAGHDPPGYYSTAYYPPGYYPPGYYPPGYYAPGYYAPGHATPGHDAPGHDTPRRDAPRNLLPGYVAPGCRDKYLDIYHRFGKLQENELTKEMSRSLLPPSWRYVASSARRQQGLLHLQRLLAGGS